MSFKRHLLVFSLVLLLPGLGRGQDFKEWAVRVAEYQKWLDQVHADPFRFWTRLDSSRRPHRLYVGEGFYQADHNMKERFIEIFSHTVAGHPEKYMLLDIFDSETELPVGEFGWGGVKLYPNGPLPMKVQAPAASDIR